MKAKLHPQRGKMTTIKLKRCQKVLKKNKEIPRPHESRITGLYVASCQQGSEVVFMGSDSNCGLRTSVWPWKTAGWGTYWLCGDQICCGQEMMLFSCLSAPSSTSHLRSFIPTVAASTATISTPSWCSHPIYFLLLCCSLLPFAKSVVPTVSVTVNGDMTAFAAFFPWLFVVCIWYQRIFLNIFNFRLRTKDQKQDRWANLNF